MDSNSFIALGIGYLLGSIPFGLLITSFAGKGDIREIGSGNIGATNVLRTGSKGLAAATLALDAVKGAAAVIIARQLSPDAASFAAAGALVGHLYPAWLRFKGGKGVATLLGVLVPLFWPAAAVYAALWIGLLIIVRISSVAGMVAAASAPLTVAVLGEQSLVPLLFGFALLVTWQHRQNIGRLARGEEPRVGSKA